MENLFPEEEYKPKLGKILKKVNEKNPISNDDDVRCYSLEEVRKILKISRELLNELVHGDSDFPVFKPSKSSRRYLVNRGELLKWIEKRTKNFP